MQHGRFDLYMPLEGYSIKLAKHILEQNAPNKKAAKLVSQMESQTLLRSYVGEHGLPTYMKTLDFLITAEEHFWDKRGRNVIFPESLEVLESIQKGRFDISMADGIEFPHNAFCLAFPSDFTLAGIKASACLCTWLPFAARVSELMEPNARRLGHTGGLRSINIHSPTGELLTDHSEDTLTVAYPTPDEFTDPAAVEAQKNLPFKMVFSYSRLVLPRSQFVDALNAKTPEDFRRTIGDLKDSLEEQKSVSTVWKLSNREAQYQMELLKLLVSIAIYTTACKDALVTGFPGERPKFMEPKGAGRFNDITLKTSIITKHESREEHYRSWYFRQLRDERFYRGEYAKMKRGSRFVFVRDTVVGAEVDAETLVGTT